MEPLESAVPKDEQPLLLELPEKPESTGKSKTETEAKGPVRLRQPQRQQFTMMVQCFDDLIGEDHPVRMVIAVVEQLDVQEFCVPIQAREGVAGRDATDPRLLIALWLYACIRGIGSAREVARRCEESIPFRWLCGGVTVNHRLLSDFRSDHGKALDNLFTQVIASLVDKGLVKVSRISQDGVRVRVGAGAANFRREERLQKLLEEVRQHVEELRQQLEAPEQIAVEKAKKVKAQKRRAEDKQKRLEEALQQLPERKQVEERTGKKVEEHLLDGGYLRMEDLEEGHRQKVKLYIPPKPARDPNKRGHELEITPGDSEAVREWKQRMASEEGKNIYKQRAATSETVNGDLRTYRGLTQILVRGWRRTDV